MYNLIVTNEQGAWEQGRYELSSSRFGEHTAKAILARYRTLGSESTSAVMALPTLLAYEDPHQLPARLARITRIRRSARPVVRFEYRIIDEVEPIPAQMLSGLKWELDISEVELRRTHWALKDVDLLETLSEAGVSIPPSVRTEFYIESSTDELAASPTLNVAPKVFSIPSGAKDPKLVSVMMPFEKEFDDVYEAVAGACADVSLACEKADDVWEEATVIQDIFNLIYRSRVVVVDLTRKNSNVLYETGIAHTLGRDVVPIAQSIEGIPFDLAHHRVLKYLPNQQGLEEMRQKLRRRLRSLTA